MSHSIAIEGTEVVFDNPPGQSLLDAARNGPRGALLENGKVLVTGGDNGTVTFASAELYDPTANTWSTANNLAVSRANAASALAASGDSANLCAPDDAAAPPAPVVPSSHPSARREAPAAAMARERNFLRESVLSTSASACSE